MPKSKFACPSSDSNVTDNRDHFPMDTVERARNALSRVAAYKRSPAWWKGSLSALVSRIKSKVRQWWPSIKVSE